MGIELKTNPARGEKPYILDEPTVGQHPADVARLLAAFRDLPGPVVFVEHDRVAAAAADHAIDLGPGAGDAGSESSTPNSPRIVRNDQHPPLYYLLLQGWIALMGDTPYTALSYTPRAILA